MTNQRRLIRVGRLARVLGIEVGWLIHQAQADRIPHLHAGHAILFDPVAVEAALVRMASQQPEPSLTILPFPSIQDIPNKELVRTLLDVQRLYGPRSQTARILRREIEHRQGQRTAPASPPSGSLGAAG